MKTIIVPLDFSEESLTGVKLSLMLAKKTKANIQLIHVKRMMIQIVPWITLLKKVRYLEK